ncbi:DUF1178 family protein [Pusillimonas sp. ANT_WB101]|uniref:DUF1178 family protein n=1 Tax=Pusillimonas sp. ANT_WB101 TaxID=2597356 RepID=UPI0011EE2562|nr:DUF1178 family protein [Pusillimonas sp. ANT_WB101]KAA0888562.1 DUF1178 family protein [Pusillimonas sp. ANT_WB101]
MTLKVYDLQCDQGHVFEGWFRSDDNYEAQRARGLLVCPVCESSKVDKKLSAPRLNVSHIRREAAGTSASSHSTSVANNATSDTAHSGSSHEAGAVAVAASAQMAQLQAEMFRQIRKVIRNTENVGVRFADEARRMHEGEAPERAIRGVATAEEREALVSEGIAVMPIPDFLDDERLQ